MWKLWFWGEESTRACRWRTVGVELHINSNTCTCWTSSKNILLTAPSCAAVLSPFQNQLASVILPGQLQFGSHLPTLSGVTRGMQGGQNGIGFLPMLKASSMRLTSIDLFCLCLKQLPCHCLVFNSSLYLLVTCIHILLLELCWACVKANSPKYWIERCSSLSTCFNKRQQKQNEASFHSVLGSFAVDTCLDRADKLWYR